MKGIVFKLTNDFVICITENNDTMYIKREYVPDGVKEDDIINIINLDIGMSIEVWK